ncbi:MAG: dihydroneopterin aldolase [Anaerolineaceae bacterium]|nr:dihydroneopterin aldolase [Anaerolineaceae bacterium]MDE0328311.1 dihydroneopterin aldolase [Anaerolineaceae bacterium]
MDVIEIDNLRLRCVIGFSPHERRDRQDVVISLRLGCDMRAASLSDDPDDALNYRSLTKDVIRLVEGSSWQLLETLASAIARVCVVEHDAQWVQVRAHKPGALRFSDSVGVCIERVRRDFERD